MCLLVEGSFQFTPTPFQFTLFTSTLETIDARGLLYIDATANYHLYQLISDGIGGGDTSIQTMNGRWRWCLAVLLDVHHIRCNIGAAYQNKAYIRAAVMATTVRMIKEEGGLSLSRYEQRRRRLYRYFHRCTSSKSCNVFVAATTMTKGGTGESDIDEYRSPRCWQLPGDMGRA